MKRTSLPLARRLARKTVPWLGLFLMASGPAQCPSLPECARLQQPVVHITSDQDLTQGSQLQIAIESATCPSLGEETTVTWGKVPMELADPGGPSLNGDGCDPPIFRAPRAAIEAQGEASLVVTSAGQTWGLPAVDLAHHNAAGTPLRAIRPLPSDDL